MNTENITWLAAAGVIGACWRQIANIVQRLRAFVVVRTTINGASAQMVQAYIWKHFRRSPFSDRYVKSTTAYVRPEERMMEVAWEEPPIQPLVFFSGRKILMMGGKPSSNADTLPDSMTIVLTTIRGMVDIDELVCNALDEFNSRADSAASSRYQVIRVGGSQNRAIRSNQPGGFESNVTMPSGATPQLFWGLKGKKFFRWKGDEVGSPVAQQPMGHLSLPESLKDATDEFRRWKDSEKWFKEKLIPWRRGWLLYGAPGTGKTSLVRALAQLADMPVWSFDVATLSNSEMISNWRRMQESTPCVALIEDIDAVFDGRENVLGENGGGLTFDCLLNCLGGIETCDGVFTVITTNRVEKVDAAIGIPQNGVSSRPGRLDRAIEMPPLGVHNLREIAQRILSDWPDLIPQVVQQGDGYTGAQFTELCVQKALELYWRPKECVTHAISDK